MKSQLISSNFIVRTILFAVAFAILGIFYWSISGGSVSILYMMSSFITGILFAFVLGSIFTKIPFRRIVRIAIAWFALFIIQMFSNILEGYFFTTQISTISLFFAATLFGLLLTFIYAFLVGILFEPKEAGSPAIAAIRGYFDQRRWSSWLWRIVICSVIYFPIYFTFGGIVSPMVLPYYTDPSNDLGLTLPSIEVLILVELFRGFLYVIALLPILASLKIEGKGLYVAIVSVLYVPGAVAPFLINPTLPIKLRIIHGLEILADYLAFGAFITYFLGERKREF